QSSGIRLTLLPSLYLWGGLDTPLSERQRRFGSASVDEFLQLFISIRTAARSAPLVSIGVAPHSLRAVTERDLHQLLGGLAELAPDAPVHMHLSEQRGEVEAFITSQDERPAEWLARRFELDSRWTFIHATHCDQRELEAITR